MVIRAFVLLLISAKVSSAPLPQTDLLDIDALALAMTNVPYERAVEMFCDPKFALSEADKIWCVTMQQKILNKYENVPFTLAQKDVVI